MEAENPTVPTTRKLYLTYSMQKGNFYERVYELVNKIPVGRVATYQQLATIVATPRAAQAVGWALRALPTNTKIPWQRVINSQGIISIENLRFPKEYQAKLLRNGGVKVKLIDGNYFVDLKKYLWHPKYK